LKSFVEKQTEVGEHDPQLLPAVAVFEFAQQVTAQLILKDSKRLINNPWPSIGEQKATYLQS